MIYSIKRISYKQIGRHMKALLKNGLKISPKKCQLFKTSLQYMENEIFIENKKGVCEAIKK